MTVRTISRRELDEDASRAAKVARNEPGFVTPTTGNPTHVALTVQEYQHLTGGQITLIEALSQPDTADFDFDPPRVTGLYRSLDSN